MALAAAFAAPVSARAAVLQAESMLAPGESGFVSTTGVAGGTGSPHLYDQQPLFSAFTFKPATFGQAGTEEDPTAGVKIVRDAFGVPAVTGTTESDMWWGAGYAGAQDRLFEMEAFRHATEGRLASLTGSGNVDDDRIVRQDMYTPAELDAMYARLAPAFKDRFTAFTAGVNAWIDHVQANPADLPGEYPATGTALVPWTVHDSVAIGVYLARTIPTNADPHSLELANMRGLQLSGSKAFNALVPLRTPGEVPTIPKASGVFSSQPGRTRAQERAGFKRSAAFVKNLPYPTTSAGGTSGRRRSATAAFSAPRLGGSYMFAAREPGGRALLYNGPQLGFSAPEKLYEIELHAPGIDLRGLTAPGVPVIGAGFNGHVAWGITTGASDADDLYAEQLVPGHPEQYMFKGQVRDMDCRDEVISYASPPSSLLGAHLPSAGSVTERVCRTVHGPVEARAGGYAYARRYAMWGRELDTLSGLAAISQAQSLADVDRAACQLTWNENVMAIDSAGSIGYWHPGLMPLRPRGWDERLPYPGTGEAEWRGFLKCNQMPHVINPKQGWLANWNTLPASGWTAGDGTARKRMDGPLFRGTFLASLVKAFAKAPSFAAMKSVVLHAATTPQQFPLVHTRLVRALAAARRDTDTDATAVLQTLTAWNGSYGTPASNPSSDPGLAAWEAFLPAAADVALEPLGPGAPLLANDTGLDALYGQYHRGANYHFFDATHGESYALRALDAGGYVTAARRAFQTLLARFHSTDPSSWSQPRPTYPIDSLGAESPTDPFPYYERGTFEELVETGPG